MFIIKCIHKKQTCYYFSGWTTINRDGASQFSESEIDRAVDSFTELARAYNEHVLHDDDKVTCIQKEIA